MFKVLRSGVYKSLTTTWSASFASSGSISSLLSTRVEESKLKNAFRFENQNKTWTFKEVNAHSTAFAYGLLELGYKPGDRILLWLDKAYTSEIVVAQLGAARAGVTIVPLLASGAGDFQKALKDTEATGLIFSANTKDENGRKRSEILYETIPELESVHIGDQPSLSSYPKLKNVVHVGFSTLPGTLKFRQLLVYGNPKFQTNKLPDSDSGAPLIYGQSEGKYKGYSLRDIQDYAEKFRSQNNFENNDIIAVSGHPASPGTFAAGPYQSIAYGNYVILYGNESFKNVAEKLNVQQPNYVVIDQQLSNEDLRNPASAEAMERVKKILVTGKDTGAYQNVFGGKSIATFNPYY